MLFIIIPVLLGRKFIGLAQTSVHPERLLCKAYVMEDSPCFDYNNKHLHDITIWSREAIRTFLYTIKRLF